MNMRVNHQRLSFSKRPFHQTMLILVSLLGISIHLSSILLVHSFSIHSFLNQRVVVSSPSQRIIHTTITTTSSSCTTCSAQIHHNIFQKRSIYDSHNYLLFKKRMFDNILPLKSRMNDQRSSGDYMNDDYEYMYPQQQQQKRKIMSNEEYELRNMKIEEEENDDYDDDYYYRNNKKQKPNRNSKRRRITDYDNEIVENETKFSIDDYDGNDDNDYETSQQESGNFWSNPKGSMDVDVVGGLDTNPRKGKNKSKKKRRGSFISYDEKEQMNNGRRKESFLDDDDEYEADYGNYYYNDEIRPNSSSRLKGSQRKTFRSGNPPPPNILKEFYNQFFWYGFDSNDTTSTNESRTMFGGTKGKFNGLGLLGDIQDIEQQKRRRRSYDYDDDDDDIDFEFDEEERQRRRRRINGQYDRRGDYNQDYYYDDDAYFDDDNNDDREYQQLGRRRKSQARTQRMPKNRFDENDNDEEEERYSYIEIDFDEDEDEFNNAPSRRALPSRDQPPPLSSSSSSPMLPQQDMDESPRKEKRKPISNDALNGRRRRSSKNQQNDPNERIGSKSRRSTTSRRSTSSVASTWFEDDDDFLENKQRDDRDGPSPLINLLDAVFQVDAEEVKYQADDYNRKLGLDDSGKRKRSSNDFDERGISTATTVRRRKGFAYRYSVEEYDDNMEDYTDSYNQSGNTLNSKSEAAEQNSNVIDVEATVQSDNSKINQRGQQLKQKQKQQAQQSWEDRAQAYERVPPKNIKAWGPEGMIDDGIDIREYSARLALDEIEKARKMFEKKEENVNVAENELIQLKRDASALKKRLLTRDKQNRSSNMRDRLRMINFEIEDAARKLRQAKGEALVAIDKLEALEFQHWALLRQYEADKELENSPIALEEVENGKNKEEL